MMPHAENKVRAKVKNAHRATPNAASVVAVVVAAVASVLRISTKRPLLTAPNRATMAAKTVVQKDAMNVALSARVALMKTATMPLWSTTPQPLSV
jgi:hypothetical protein